MKDLRAGAKSLGKAGCRHGLHHKFLYIDIVVCVLATIENVHHRHGHSKRRGTIDVGDVLIQRNPSRACSSLRRSQRNRKNRISAKRGLVIGAVSLNHGCV